MLNGEVLVRAVPTKFRTPGHVVRGNLVYEKQPNGSLSLVGQLEELGSTESGNLAKLCGGDKGLQFLSAAGSVASILNLGVSVLGFLHVSKLLRRIERRIERVEGQLEQVAELVGVMDQKVDQLIELSEAQTSALSEVHNLIVSFQTAKVHAALNTLDLLSTAESAPDRDERLRDAAETLQIFRIWLADKRDSTAGSAMAARAELLRAEVGVALAECRARCLADDEELAGRALDRVIAGARAEVERMYEWLVRHDGLRHLVRESYNVTQHGTVPFDTSDALEAVAWVEGTGLVEAALKLLDSPSRSELEAVRQDLTVQAYDIIGHALLQKYDDDSLPDPSQDEIRAFLAGELLTNTESSQRDSSFLGLSEPIDDFLEAFAEFLKALADEAGATAELADAASFVATHRLARDLESARALCAAMEVFGDPVRELLLDSAPPNSPALSIEWKNDLANPI